MGIFDKLFGKRKKLTFTWEEMDTAFKTENYEKLTYMWDHPVYYMGYDEDGMYGDYDFEAPTVTAEFATKLIDAATSNWVSGRDTFKMFKFLVDLGVKITEPGYLDDDDFYFTEYCFNTDGHKFGSDYPKYMDYVVDQIVELDLEYFKQFAKNPLWFNQPFKEWVVSRPELDKLRQDLYDYTDDIILLSSEEKELFVF